MKKKIIFCLVVLIIILLGIFYFNLRKNNIDNIEKIKKCAKNLYEEKKKEGINFSSQCLGTCFDYAVDVVHVPRSEEDNLPENQCKDYREGKVKHFIELDKDGRIVRIV